MRAHYACRGLYDLNERCIAVSQVWPDCSPDATKNTENIV